MGNIISLNADRKTQFCLVYHISCLIQGSYRDERVPTEKYNSFHLNTKLKRKSSLFGHEIGYVINVCFMKSRNIATEK